MISLTDDSTESDDCTGKHVMYIFVSFSHMHFFWKQWIATQSSKRYSRMIEQESNCIHLVCSFVFFLSKIIHDSLSHLNMITFHWAHTACMSERKRDSNNSIVRIHWHQTQILHEHTTEFHSTTHLFRIKFLNQFGNQWVIHKWVSCEIVFQTILKFHSIFNDLTKNNDNICTCALFHTRKTISVIYFILKRYLSK